ncbi:MAG TPA: hypothetical protein VH439_17205 [Gemmatimonadales bacterium]|jgi:hypothetical protein
MRTRHYEPDPGTFYEDAYAVTGYGGVAFHVLGWETEPDEDTEWSGLESRTGQVLAVMIGDDYRHRVDVDDLTPLPASAYCRDCGQIGCGHNVIAED